jgi:environmental stress-induced protein Ves
MKIIRYSALAVIPWKNSAGVRRDLVSGELAETKDSAVAKSTWMIGLADLNQDAPFSSYAGVSRWFMPIGNGRLTLMFKVGLTTNPVELHGASNAHFFSGDDELTMLLHDGPMKALNVMTTGRVPKVSMERLHCQKIGLTLNEEEGEQDCLNLLLVEKGRCRVITTTGPHVLEALDSFTCGTKERATVEADDVNGCDVINVRLRY